MNVLADLLGRAGAQFAERTALVGERRSLRFAEVEAESNRLASAFLAHLGFARGDRVAILLANCPEFAITDFALIKGGLVRVPVNPRYTASEIEYILAHSGAVALVTSNAFLAVIGEIPRAKTALRNVILVDDGVSTEDPTKAAIKLATNSDTMPATKPVANTTTKSATAVATGPAFALDPPSRFDDIGWNALLEHGSPTRFLCDVEPDDVYMIAYTSGTTGRPKGAVTTFKARFANVMNVYANEMFVSHTDVMLHVASLAHGSGTKVFPFYVKGAKNVLMQKFSTAGFFAAVEKHRVTASWMVPTIVAMVTDAPERTRHDCSSLRTIIYGGAPMPEPVIERALQAFGPIFVQMYGLTEAPHPDLVLGKEDHGPDPKTGRRVAGVTGRASIGVRIRLVDQQGRDVPQGEVGEMLIGGDHVMSGYWNDPAATAETLRDGWCHTGDLARMDAKGFYSIVDRRKEMIISGGYNVYPREVEEVLYRHPAIVECAVIGYPDSTWGEGVHALIVSKPSEPLDEDAVTAHCARYLAGYKKPRRITLLDALPKTANGKIDKKVLRSQYGASSLAADRATLA